MRCNGIPCKIFTEISPRLARSRRDQRDLAEIAEISPRSRHDVSWILNLGEIAARYPPSRRDYRDLADICRDLTTMFEKPTNVMARSQRSLHDICWFLKSRRVRGEIFYISPRLARSRLEIRLFLYLAKILKNTNFLPRLPKYNPIIPRWNE